MKRTFQSVFYYKEREDALQAAERWQSKNKFADVSTYNCASIYEKEYNWAVIVSISVSEDDIETAKYAAEQYAFLIKGDGDVSGEDFASRMRVYYDSTKLQICAAAAEKYIKTISADMKGNAHIVYNF